MKENSKTTILRVKENIHGKMGESIPDNGSTTRWMAKVCSLGPMEESMKVVTKMTRKKAMESSSGLMVAATTDSGRMVSSMVSQNTMTAEATSNVAGGKMADDKNGSADSSLT